MTLAYTAARFLRSNQFKKKYIGSIFIKDRVGNKLKFTIEKMTDIAEVETWSPCEDLFTQHPEKSYAVIILNTPIDLSFNQNFIVQLWNQAKVRLTVDGGTKHWLQWLKMNERELEDVQKPELITGDMDSLTEEVLNYFKKNGVAKVVVTPDQNETDYVKGLRELNKYCSFENIQIDTVYVLAETCGRFDQIMANINALFKSKDILGYIKVFQIASTSLTWLLREGCHSISIPHKLRKNQEWCALIPIGSPCTVTSTGLKWNLENSNLEFGALVSTSNTYDGSPTVTIHTDVPVVWSMSINPFL